MNGRRCVVLGEVTEPRSVDDREALRASLEAGIARANEALREQLVAPFSVLRGVEAIGGVLTDPERSYRALREITEAVLPVEMRFAVVHGQIDVGLATEAVSRMDGPAFQEADRLLAELATEERAVAFADPDVEPWIRTLLADQIQLLQTIKRAWTAHQAELVRAYRREENMQAIADERGVSVQTVSQTLARANATQIMTVESNLDAALSAVWGWSP
ncbi:SatD family protein [Haloarcula salinisoli]|uniref:SatD family protein n=1 Tax=Haloarcula salinisoli TaxID=2487746 RepID=A0A8J7YF62_9EURY|nr:SatD family protein [Halomicroarcula salinisoli]MBX0286304.1 SatD family protein [Halomicroarcula salinisoli]MBX0302208.1 SatD family protein [Halomicroarcula salinisoli]